MYYYDLYYFIQIMYYLVNYYCYSRVIYQVFFPYYNQSKDPFKYPKVANIYYRLYIMAILYLDCINYQYYCLLSHYFPSYYYLRMDYLTLIFKIIYHINIYSPFLVVSYFNSKQKTN